LGKVPICRTKDQIGPQRILAIVIDQNVGSYNKIIIRRNFDIYFGSKEKEGKGKGREREGKGGGTKANWKPSKAPMSKLTVMSHLVSKRSEMILAGRFNNIRESLFTDKMKPT